MTETAIKEASIGGQPPQQADSADFRETSAVQSSTPVDLSTIKDSAIERLVAERGKLTASLRTFTDDLRGMQQASQEPGLATSLVGQAADYSDQLISYVEDREPDQLLAEARSYARTHPAMFLLGAVVAGGVLGRVTRSAGAASSNGSQEAEAPVAVDLR